ncbi:MAG: ROK family transcriptional regulator [Sphaerochaetaceae bacterium]|nr:ROK family transcriptional regulator [Sphaerochaetaceae bacterium]
MQNDDLEFINCKDVLRCIEHELDKPSRAQVAQHLGLSRTAISMIAQRLIKVGLVKELESAKKGRGRPGTPLVPDDSTWHAIGAAYYSGTWSFVVINLLGKVVVKHHMPVISTDMDKIVTSLIEGLRYMRSCCPGTMLQGFGIGSPGLVDHRTGSVFRADDLGWKEILPIKEIVEQRTGVRAFVINRYRANGLAEIRFGNHNRSHNMIYLGIGTGIAGSIYLDRVLLNSTKYRLGHMVIDPNGPVCGCGQHGCLQAMASEGALISYARSRMEQDPTFLGPIRRTTLSGKMIAKLAEEGDDNARQCIAHIAQPLAIAICTLANAIAPDEVIIGGPLGDTSSYLVDCVRSRVYERLLDWQVADMVISKGTQGDYGAAIGSATFLLDHKLELIFGESCPD